MDLISVIIPAYNAEKHLERCLDSVCGQSYKDLEILLVDDGSSDSTPQICDSYAKKDGRIKVIHKENGGVAAARNTALDMMTGAMAAFSDSDDYYEPGVLESMHRAMLEHNADMVCCGYYEEFDDRITEYGTGLGEVIYDRHDAFEEYFKMGGRIGSGCWNKLIRSEVIRDIRYKPYVMGEDVEMLLRTIDRCDRVVCIDYPGYHYIHRGDSATRAVFSENNINMLHIADEMLEYIKERHPELTEQMYAYNAAWYTAQIQAMYWSKDTSVFAEEKRLIKSLILSNMEGYRNNTYIPARDMLYLRSFMYGCFRPVQAACELLSGMKRRLRK
ncbi:MAG: glycosyltransferase [Lachnospiraceae bacterium]|nr:glycosyltransferase [Lachnospiraceae bacterium]